jgi:HD-like signal output (HDOD) protein
MTTSDKLPSNIFRKQAPRRILRSELNHLIKMLRMTDSSLIKFGQEVSMYPMVYKQILRAANSSLTGSAVEISDVAHATLFLGSRRVEFLLNTLPPEIIEEDAEDNESAV